MTARADDEREIISSSPSGLINESYNAVSDYRDGNAVVVAVASSMSATNEHERVPLGGGKSGDWV